MVVVMLYTAPNTPMPPPCTAVLVSNRAHSQFLLLMLFKQGSALKLLG